MAACKWLTMKTIVVLFLHIVVVFGTDYVPVLVWNAKGSVGKHNDLPSLAKLSTEEFSDLFLKKLSGKKGPQPVIVVFVEENLSIEDFSWKDTDGHTSYPHLENLTSAAKYVDFFPAVHAPIKGLKRLGYRWQTVHLEDKRDEISLPSDGGVVLVVKLGDARSDEDRPDFLKRHDYVISEIYNDLLAKNKEVIAFYTSHHSSWVEPIYEPLVRRIRSVVMLDENISFWNDSDIYFYSSETPVFQPNVSDPSKNINITTATCRTDKRQSYESLKCKFNNNNDYYLEFRFTLSEMRYWYLSVYIKDNNENKTEPTLLSTDRDIYAPEYFSYHCTPETVFKSESGSMALILKNFQIQPNVTRGEFGDAYDCVGYFSIPILSGLLVTFLLGIILMMGLVALMDINTMDRFDDPKGKPLTINSSD